MLYWIGKKVNDLTSRVPFIASKLSLNQLNHNWPEIAHSRCFARVSTQVSEKNIKVV